MLLEKSCPPARAAICHSIFTLLLLATLKTTGGVSCNCGTAAAFSDGLTDRSVNPRHCYGGTQCLDPHTHEPCKCGAPGCACYDESYTKCTCGTPGCRSFAVCMTIGFVNPASATGVSSIAQTRGKCVVAEKAPWSDVDDDTSETTKTCDEMKAQYPGVTNWKCTTCSSGDNCNLVETPAAPPASAGTAPSADCLAMETFEGAVCGGAAALTRTQKLDGTCTAMLQYNTTTHTIEPVLMPTCTSGTLIHERPPTCSGGGVVVEVPGYSEAFGDCTAGHSVYIKFFTHEGCPSDSAYSQGTLLAKWGTCKDQNLRSSRITCLSQCVAPTHPPITTTAPLPETTTAPSPPLPTPTTPPTPPPAPGMCTCDICQMCPECVTGICNGWWNPALSACRGQSGDGYDIGLAGQCPTPAPGGSCTCFLCGSYIPTTSFGICGPSAPDCSATAGNPTAGCYSYSECSAGDCQCAAGTCEGGLPMPSPPPTPAPGPPTPAPTYTVTSSFFAGSSCEGPIVATRLTYFDGECHQATTYDPTKREVIPVTILTGAPPTPADDLSNDHSLYYKLRIGPTCSCSGCSAMAGGITTETYTAAGCPASALVKTDYDEYVPDGVAHACHDEDEFGPASARYLMPAHSQRDTCSAAAGTGSSSAATGTGGSAEVGGIVGSIFGVGIIAGLAFLYKKEVSLKTAVQQLSTPLLADLSGVELQGHDERSLGNGNSHDELLEREPGGSETSAAGVD